MYESVSSRCVDCFGFAVADILLWRNRNLSAGILAGATLIWFLFDVVEYNIVTLLCHIALVGMLLLFIWSNAAPLFDRLYYHTV